MSFLYPISIWLGAALLAAPVLIHLINLRRQQRIRWAAMQFLIESQRRNRSWILLKQLLLMAARIGIIALLLLLTLHLVLRNEWLSLLDRGTTHHLVLLDDSYSMSDRWSNTTALDEGKRAVQAIVDQADQQADTHLLTLLRFSEAAGLSAGAQPKVFAEPINDSLRSKLESLLAGIEPAQSDVGPADALKAIPRLPLADDENALVVYLVSDFRQRQFGNATEVRKLLSDLSDYEHVAQIHLVRCVREARPNLALTTLAPESGVRAAGVEMWMSVTVANYSDAPARNVVVQLEQDGNALPALMLDDIPPRDEVTHKFRVQFAGIGTHALTATLPADAVEIDNRRYFACDLPAARPVLIIDGSPDGLGGRQLSLALAPGGNTRTGWQPHVEQPQYLADVERLKKESAIFLLDVPRLADSELAALEGYLRDGGGVAVYVGPNADRSFYNDRFFRNGDGPFPAPLKLPTELMRPSGDELSDVEVMPHTLFQVLGGRRNDFLPLLQVNYYYALPDDWAPADKDHVRVLARLRNKAPLVVEKQFGDGRLVAHFTKLSNGETPLGRWTNWSLNPAFPVLANEQVSYLAAKMQSDPLYRIGDELVVSVEEGKFESTFRFSLPAEPGSAGGGIRAEVPVEATPSSGMLSAKLEDVATSGIYGTQLQPLQGEPERRIFAVNVPNGEGDLAVSPGPDLTRQLAGVEFQMHDASEMALDTQQLAGFQMGDTLLALLIGLLLAEQVFAYLASYHVAPLVGAAR